MAEEKIATGQFVVSFSAEDDQKTWIVNALEKNIYNDLSGYARVIPFQKALDENQICINRDTDCILEIYKKLDVDALMLGTVDDSDIEYEIYDVKNKYLVKTGSIEIGGGSSLLKLRMGAFKAFKAFIEKGGILDKRKYSATNDVDENEINKPIIKNSSNIDFKNKILLYLVVFTWIPYLLSFIGKPIRHPERSRIVLRWFYPFQIMCTLIIGYGFILQTIGAVNVFSNILDVLSGYHWILAGAGGIVWGFFLITNLKVIIPNIQGIERIKPGNIFPLIQSCFLVSLVKFLIVVSFYSVFFYWVSDIGNLFFTNQEAVIVFLFPLSGLFILYWISLLLEVLSMSIDVRLSERKFAFRNTWDSKVRKYFISYLKRNGVAFQRQLVDETIFLKGNNKGVICYGGGFSPPRIAIDKDLIEFAIGDADQSEGDEEKKLDLKYVEPILRQNSVFQMVPNLTSKNIKRKLSTSRQFKKKVRNLNKVKKLYERDLSLLDKKTTRRVKNVMQGLFFPKLDGGHEFPSLLSDSLDDAQVIEQLLLEYSRAGDRYDEDAEIDDSSEQDKDFLFGIILHKFGGVLRRENIFSTLYLYIVCKKGSKTKSYNFPFSRYFSVVGDTFVVLNFGLNHLMQYLYYMATNNLTHLTTKGITSQMLTSQDEILTNTRQLIGERKPLRVQTDELDRIVWLSRFCQDSIQVVNPMRIIEKKIYKWSVAFGVTYLASMTLINSYNYHQSYVQIIEQEKQDIVDAIQNEQEKVRKEK